MEPQLCLSEAALIQNNNLLPIVQCYYQLRDWNVAVSLPRTGQYSITSQTRLHQDMKWMPLISTFQACFRTLKEHSHFQLKTQLCLSYVQQYSWFCYPKGHSCLTAFIPKVKIFPYPKFSKSTLFMFCELHKTFIHPEFYCFHSIKIFVRNVCLNGSCKLWWCAWKRKALKNTKQNSEWKFDTWNWAENLKAARQPISFFFVSQWWHLLHTFLLRG